MAKRLARLALLYISACLMTGCEGGAPRSSASLDAGVAFAEKPALSSPGEALRRAEALRLDGADAEALGVLAAAYRRYPRHGGVQSAYGRLALAMGHDELAAQLLENAVASNPDDWRALSAQGVLEWRSGRPSEARGTLLRLRRKAAFAQAVALAGNHAQPCLNTRIGLRRHRQRDDCRKGAESRQQHRQIAVAEQFRNHLSPL